MNKLNFIIMKTYTTEEQAQIGAEVAKLFGMRKNRNTGRYNTTWGDKTAVGLFNTVLRVAEDISEGNFKL